MPDYSKGKIYKILNTIDDEIYVGSTIETLSMRMAKHRSKVNVKPHYKLYEHMNKLGVDNFYIELIENFPCNDIYELRAREGHFIREIGTLNKRIAGRTDKEYNKEYKEKHKEAHKEYMKTYNEDHKERIKQYKETNKEYINEQITCDICGCQVCRNNMSRHQKTNKCKNTQILS